MEKIKNTLMFIAGGNLFLLANFFMGGNLLGTFLLMMGYIFCTIALCYPIYAVVKETFRFNKKMTDDKIIH